MAQASSQWVDQQWGGESWDPKTAERLRRPFSGKKILFVEPSDEQKYEDVKVSRAARSSLMPGPRATLRTCSRCGLSRQGRDSRWCQPEIIRFSDRRGPRQVSADPGGAQSFESAVQCVMVEAVRCEFNRPGDSTLLIVR